MEPRRDFLSFIIGIAVCKLLKEPKVKGVLPIDILIPKVNEILIALHQPEIQNDEMKIYSRIYKWVADMSNQ